MIKLADFIGALAIGSVSVRLASNVADGLYDKDPEAAGNNLAIGLALSGGSWWLSKKVLGKESLIPLGVLLGTSGAYIAAYINTMPDVEDKEEVVSLSGYDGCQLHGLSCDGIHRSGIGGLGATPAYLEPAFASYTTDVPPSRWDVPRGLV